MSHFRRCDTKKYHKRMIKQRENRSQNLSNQQHVVENREIDLHPYGICRLCRVPFTEMDVVNTRNSLPLMNNCKLIQLNGKGVKVHITCPTEVK